MEIDDHLQYLATVMDGSQWCKLQERELGFDDVTIRTNKGFRANTWPHIVTVAGGYNAADRSEDRGVGDPHAYIQSGPR